MRPAAGQTPTAIVSDDLSGTWELLGQAPSGGSTVTAILMRRNAAGIGSVSITATAGTYDQVSAIVREFNGASPGAVTVDSAQHESALVWPPVEVAAPAGALVLGSLSLGVTNRDVDLVEGSTYGEAVETKSTQLYHITAHRILTGAATTGPAWHVTGGSTPNAASASAVTIAIAAEEGGAQPLIVSVGVDKTAQLDEGVPVVAAVSGGQGARSFDWSIQSGPAGGGDISDPSAASTTFVGSIAGTYVLRCTVTDSTGTVSDDLTVTVLRNLTVLPVAAINSSTGWTATGGAVLAVLSDSDDGTYITSGENPTNQILDVRLPALAVPDQPLVLRLRARALNAASATVVGRLYSGGTLRATSDAAAISGTFGQVDVTFPLAALTGITSADWEAGVRATFSVTAA